MNIYFLKRSGIVSRRRRASSGAALIAIALLLALLGGIVALALTQIAFQSQATAIGQMDRSSALAAARAGLERGVLAVKSSSIMTDHNPVTISGSFTNSSYSATATWVAGMQISLSSTGTCNGKSCTLTRTATADVHPDLRGINYVSGSSPDSEVDYDFLPGYEPIQSATRAETPNFDYFRQLAQAQGHYYSGSVTFNSNLTPGVYFSETQINVNCDGTGVTLVTPGDINFSKENAIVTSGDWTMPALVAGGEIWFKKGNQITGVVYCTDLVTAFKDCLIVGRLDIGSVSAHKDCEVTDNGNADVYQQLQGFTYSSGTITAVNMSGWSEQY